MKPFACTPAEQPDDEVPATTAEPSGQPVALDDPDAGGGEVELALVVDARQLGRLAADQRDPGGAADLRGPLDELGDLLELEPAPRRRSRAGSTGRRRG